MVLITGAAGKTGQAVIRALHKKKKMPVRALVHKNNQIHLVKELGVRDAVVGDIRSRQVMKDALKGVQAVYHICPNVHAEEIEIGRNVIGAAQSVGVEHLVYHSVFHPQVEAMPHHWQKMRVEEQLFASGLAYTILQPAPYMQNLLSYWKEIMQERKYRVPYSAKTQISLVDLEDVAGVAAMVINEPDHMGATYELCGADYLSPVEITHSLSQYLGYCVEVETIPIEEWKKTARSNGVREYAVDTLTKMFRYYEQYGYAGNSRILACLLQRPPTRFAVFLERIKGHG